MPAKWDDPRDLIRDEAEPDSPPLEWNVIVTAREGHQRRLRRALFPLVRLRRCGFRNVLVGQVESTDALLGAMAERIALRPELQDWLGKVMPIERSFAMEVARFDEQLRAEAAPLVDRLAGRTYHVRVERRGHKGTINSHACERALGDFLFAELETRGAHPVVAFRDPDVVIAIEAVGNRAGIALVTRELRARYPFVRID
jgi:tRNA(Ser,Leu) C12 N-acetylase TAN1